MQLERRRDPKTGWFLPTTDSTIYRAVQFNGKRMQAHHREFCLLLNIPQIPKGLIVHHIDGDPQNNDIDNLSLMSVTAHNRVHSHEPWNKGIKKGMNKKWDSTLKKLHASRRTTFLKRFKTAYDLRQTGMSVIEIAKQLNKDRNVIYHHIKKYEQYIKQEYRPGVTTNAKATLYGV